MPKYLIISDDLQIVTDGGYAFVSRSAKELADVESDVDDWVQDNPIHPRRGEAEIWLTSASDEIERRSSMEDRRKLEEALIHDMEKLLRRFARTSGRSKGWSREKIRQHANRQAEMAAMFLNDDPDEIIAKLQKSSNKC